MMGIDDEELNASKISTYNDKNMYNKLVHVRLTCVELTHLNFKI